MSNELQHRLYHYEVAPPDATWDKIVSELDDSHLSNRFPAILLGSAITPRGHIYRRRTTRENWSINIRTF